MPWVSCWAAISSSRMATRARPIRDREVELKLEGLEGGKLVRELFRGGLRVFFIEAFKHSPVSGSGTDEPALGW